MTTFKHGFTIVFSVAAFLFFASCTGGGGGGSNSTNNNDDDELNPDETHANLTWDGSAGVCLSCHKTEALQMHGSTHYQWQGRAVYMTNGPASQGKIGDAVNSYCINILGNWETCGSCHVGLGAQPLTTDDPDDLELANIDCLICHQKEYKRIKSNGKFIPDSAAMTITLDQAVQTVHLPERSNCIQCHAKAGGGDAVKRGDLALASAVTQDVDYDVHMATSGADLNCQECHIVSDHKIAGKGSDIRPTDLDLEVTCTQCHENKMTLSGHDDKTIGRHVSRVACQTCHIPFYAKDADDTFQSEATETHRTWRETHSASVPFHPRAEKANNRVPKYRFWNRYSNNYLLGDPAILDTDTNAYPTSRPEGSVTDIDPDNKLYPFKYKTAEQPIINDTDQLIALDTKVFFATADADAATQAGLMNMGFDANEPYTWIKTDTYQLLNHQVSSKDQALKCSDCHTGTSRINLQEDLGYALKDPIATVCNECHEPETPENFYKTHEKHVEDKELECSNCHIFSRPER